MFKPILSILASLAVAAVVASGCGGGDSTLTKAEFVKQADALCQKVEKKKQAAMESFLQKTGAGPTKPLTLVQEEKLETDVILPPLRTEAEELSELGVPEGGEAKANAVVEGFLKVVEKLQERPTLLANLHVDPFAEVAKLAGEYGFKTCIRYY